MRCKWCVMSPLWLGAFVLVCVAVRFGGGAIHGSSRDKLGDKCCVGTDIRMGKVWPPLSGGGVCCVLRWSLRLEYFSLGTG